MPDETAKIQATVPKADRDRLEEIAKADGRTLGNLAGWLLRQYAQEHPAPKRRKTR